MKKLVILLAAAGVLSGCVVYPADGYRGRHGGYYRDHDQPQYQYRGDRDRDGVPDRQDSRPYNPYRY